MAESLAAFGVVPQLLDLTVATWRILYYSASSITFFARFYGLPAGAAVWIFGNRGIWRIQMQVLLSKNDQHAMDFKKSAQNESNIIAVASTILAQIAITALSLPDLSQTHWVARASFTFSLVSAIMAVYYATRQYRVLGRCLRADQVKSWIKSERLVASFPIFTRIREQTPRGTLPSAASVLTISAPNMLLSTSLNSFLIGLGVYLGFIWTRKLDELAGAYDSRAVFITYVVGLAFCYGVYALSGAVVEDQSYVSEWDMFRKLNNIPQMAQQHDAVEQAINHIAMQSPGASGEQVESPPAPSETNQRSESHVRNFQDDDTRQELLQAFREAARLRQESAKVDERLSRLLERLG